LEGKGILGKEWGEEWEERQSESQSQKVKKEKEINGWI
jgi:hypothetical protein